MPVDFTGNAPASVDMGDGGAHSPQIRFEADDNSCDWNGFPICITNPPPRDCSGFLSLIGSPSQQLPFVPFITTPGAGGSTPSNAQWPVLYVYEYLRGLQCGFKLQARIRFNAHGTTSVGSVAVQSAIGLCSPGKPGPILGDYDSGFFDISCADCTTAPDVLGLTLNFTNFNPVPPAQVQIEHGILDVQWTTGGTLDGEFETDTDYSLAWRPPCYVAQGPDDLDAGLYIQLPSNGCGDLTMTYGDIQTAVNALDLGLSATILGGHNFDIARADPNCGAFPYCCDMDGAICSGTAGDALGGGIVND